jgi:hypothetical protein
MNTSFDLLSLSKVNLRAVVQTGLPPNHEELNYACVDVFNQGLLMTAVDRPN